MNHPPVFLLVAGELSGDLLGGGLIRSLKKIYPEAKFIGVGGPEMVAEGFESIAPIETLSIMGLFEVIKHLPELLRLKRMLIDVAKSEHPVAFIGIDAPDFNLRLAKSLKKLEILTFHYVSPSIWVWREKRALTIKNAIDQVLCLFPFEPPLYKKYGVDAVCVGHRLGDEISFYIDTRKARDTLNLESERRYLAILPGSRLGEVERLFTIFIDTAVALVNKNDDLSFVIPAANEKIYELLKSLLDTLDEHLSTRFLLFHGQSRLVMEASNAVLLASGTAALEAMLLKKPMVVAYKFNALTAWFAKRIVKTKYFSLPNILSNKMLVPEVFQEQVEAHVLVPLIEKALEDESVKLLEPQFLELHHSLRLNADETAAISIHKKIESFH